MSRQWGNQRQKQGGVQGLNNGKSNASLQQQQLSAAQLTYAQKVKGRRTAQPKAQQLQQGQGGMRNPQFRMVQTQNILQPQVSALQNYAYPYNYSNLQQQQQQQRRPPTTQPQPQSQQQQSANPYRTRRGTGPQRDFFDRRVQHNVNNAVSQYYNYPTPQNNSNGMNRYVPNRSQRQRQQQQPPPPQQQQSMYRQQSNPQFRFNSNNNMSNNNNMNMNMRGRRNQRFRGGRGGGRGSFGQRPSYRDSQRPNFNRMQQQQQGNSVSNKANKRTKPSELQLNRYQNAADRDVLCWIFENQGKCRYGEKCQWLHLDRETGQYIPTVYIMNSLSDKNIRKDTICKEVEPKKDDKDDKDEKEKEEADDNDEKVEEAEDDDTDPEELKNKFLLLMAEGIKKRKKEEKERLIEEETKKNEEEKEKAQQQKRGKDEEDEDTKEQQQQQQCLPVDSDKKSKYASYGTTFDRHNVCWEFNTFVGCRKGSKCKWAHQYLVKESAHPYTGEKLNGMAVRKFRVSNNI